MAAPNARTALHPVAAWQGEEVSCRGDVAWMLPHNNMTYMGQPRLESTWGACIGGVCVPRVQLVRKVWRVFEALWEAGHRQDAGFHFITPMQSSVPSIRQPCCCRR
jgi:hypothetical protein